MDPGEKSSVIASVEGECLVRQVYCATVSTSLVRDVLSTECSSNDPWVSGLSTESFVSLSNRAVVQRAWVLVRAVNFMAGLSASVQTKQNI